MDRYRVDFASQPWETPGVGARSKAHQDGGKRLRLLELTREFSEPDWCLKGHIGYVLEGRLEVDFSGHVVAFGPGDGVFIPPGEGHKHKAKALTESVTLILVEEV
jgi:ethanolamine utilization protein EutQ (cupin superfamily)